MQEVAASLGANGVLIRTVDKNKRTIGTSYGSAGTTGNEVKLPDLHTNTLHGVAIFVIDNE